jgi:transcriptional regulator with XRE-family HTH domain
MSYANAPSRHLAHNLVALRKKKSLSQQRLSSLADIPRSTVTHMEAGEGKPSLRNLCKLAAALNVGVEELLSRPCGDCVLLQPGAVPALASSAGEVIVHKLMPDKVRGIEIDRVEIKAHSSTDGQAHLQGSKEYLMALDGQLTVSVGGEDFCVNKGGVLAFPGDQNHAYRNEGEELAVVLRVVIPIPYLLDSDI